MVRALDDACHASSDSIEMPTVVAHWELRSGKRGRPKKECNPEFLAYAMDLGGTTDTASLFGWSARTVSRRAVEYGVRPPGAPVFENVTLPDGSTSRIHQSSTRPTSTLTDDELNFVVAALESFPEYKRAMLNGHLVAMGHHVPKKRLRESFIRVHGVPGIFGARHIQRRVYKVAGANALWHHDGQHGAQNTL